MSELGILRSLIKQRIQFTVISDNLIYAEQEGRQFILIVHLRNGDKIKAKEIYRNFAIRDLTGREIAELRELREAGIIFTDEMAREVDGEESKIHYHHTKENYITSIFQLNVIRKQTKITT